VLTSVLGGLAPIPTGIARDPVSGLFYVTRVSNGLLRVGVAVAEDAQAVHGARLALFSAGLLPIEGATLSELRAIGFVPPSVEADATQQTGRALLVANVPSALALANISPGSSGNGRVQRLTEIGSGGSRITVGSIGGRSIAAVSCLASREIYVVDLSSMDVRAVIPNLSGPHGLAIDDTRQMLYVTDFRSSVVRIVDLSPLTQAGSEESVRIIATLGTPRVVQELQ
jgi:DNA-binding beta-propeller fold protein YncE